MPDKTSGNVICSNNDIPMIAIKLQPLFVGWRSFVSFGLLCGGYILAKEPAMPNQTIGIRRVGVGVSNHQSYGDPNWINPGKTVEERKYHECKRISYHALRGRTPPPVRGPEPLEPEVKSKPGPELSVSVEASPQQPKPRKKVKRSKVKRSVHKAERKPKPKLSAKELAEAKEGQKEEDRKARQAILDEMLGPRTKEPDAPRLCSEKGAATALLRIKVVKPVKPAEQEKPQKTKKAGKQTKEEQPKEEPEVATQSFEAGDLGFDSPNWVNPGRFPEEQAFYARKYREHQELREFERRCFGGAGPVPPAPDPERPGALLKPPGLGEAKAKRQSKGALARVRLRGRRRDAPTFGEPPRALLREKTRERIMRKARKLERETKAKGKQNGCVSLTGLSVLEVLLFSFYNKRTGQTFPSYDALQKATGFCRQTIAVCIRRLERCGFLKVFNRMKRESVMCKDANGRMVEIVRVVQTSNAYTMHAPDEPDTTIEIPVEPRPFPDYPRPNPGYDPFQDKCNKVFKAAGIDPSLFLRE